MSFFIRGKKKSSEGSNKNKNSLKRKKNNFKPKANDLEDGEDDDNDEEIVSDSDEEVIQNHNKYSSGSDEDEETVQEKRLRLAHQYLEEIEKQEKERLEAEEIDKDAIGQRLKEDVLEKAGRFRKTVADSYSGFGEFEVLKCKEHSRSVTSLVISADNKFIFSASDDFNIVKWSVQEKKKLQAIKRNDEHSHKKKILALAISSDFKFLASGDNSAKLYIWNPTDMKFIHSFAGHKIAVTGLAFRRDSHDLYSCSSDKTIKIWNLDEMTYVETLFGHTSGITSIDAYAKERMVTSGGRDSTIRLWKIVEESHLILNGYKESIDCVKMLTEDHYISGSDAGNVSLWSINKKKPICNLKEAHGLDPTNKTPNWIVSIAAYHYTDLFATGSFNGIINFYKCDERLKSFTKFMEVNLEGNINCMTFTRDGQYLIAGVGQEHRFGRWHTRKSVKNSIVFIPLLKKKS